MTAKEKHNAYMKEWNRKNPDKVRASRKRRLPQIVANNKLWREKNREHFLATKKAYRQKNKERIRIWAARCYAKRKTNPKRLEELRTADRARNKRYRMNPNFRLLHSLRKRIWTVLNGAKKSETTERLLGCSLDDFRIYIESRWEPGMDWSNYGNKRGQWSIDHIMPCVIFDLTKPEHQKRCFHFSNMRPFWHVKNLRKHAKVTTNQFNLL